MYFYWGYKVVGNNKKRVIRRITDTSIPKELFKYRDWSVASHKKTISRRQIYFPRPSSFNDPFDGSIPIRWDLMSFDDCVEKNAELLKASGIGSSDDTELNALAVKVTKEKTMWHPEKLKKESKEKMDIWDKAIGLFSLSETAQNILMWSHYASNHTGFAVGFHTDYFSERSDFDYMEPIQYQVAYSVISGLDSTNQQFFKKFFFKSDLWGYEKEWRISINHIEKRIVNLAPEAFSQIILGCKMPQKEKVRIIKKSRRMLGNQIKIQQAIMSDENFEIKLDRIN